MPSYGRYGDSASCAQWTSEVWGGWHVSEAHRTTDATTLTWQAWTSDSTVTSTAMSTTTVTIRCNSEKQWLYWSSDEGREDVTRRVSRTMRREVERPRSAEEEARIKYEQDWNRARIENENRNIQTSEKRGYALLESCLNKQQLKDWKKDKFFFVVGSKTGTVYRIRDGTKVANIDVMDKDGHVKHRLCGHPAAYVPMGDVLLAQKLYLEVLEEAFVKLANIHQMPHQARGDAPVVQPDRLAAVALAAAS